MNAITTFNPKTLLGPGDFHDWQYEAFSARADAIDSYVDWRMDELKSMIVFKTPETFERAMENLADDSKKLDKLYRWLFQVWQCWGSREEVKDKMSRYAVSIIGDLLNDAVVKTLESEAKAQIE